LRLYNIAQNFRDIKISLCRYLWMLTLPFIASLCIVISFALNYIENKDANDELKASLNGYIDWQNAIYIIGPSHDVK
jgi:hypothetical protein